MLLNDIIEAHKRSIPEVEELSTTMVSAAVAERLRSLGYID